MHNIGIEQDAQKTRASHAGRSALMILKLNHQEHSWVIQTALILSQSATSYGSSVSRGPIGFTTANPFQEPFGSLL